MKSDLPLEQLPGPGRRRFLFVGALALAGSTALLTWWTTSLIGLPDVGDPFDVAAFGRPIPDDSNAFVLYRRASALLAKEPSESVDHWAKAGPLHRNWLEASREALAIWREGTGRPDALDVSPNVLTFESRFDIIHELRKLGRLSVLEGTRLEEGGDLQGALDWYLALFRSSRHCGRRGLLIERLVGIGIHRWACTHLMRWAADPRVDAGMLRSALDAVIAADATTPPASDGMKAEYVSLMHSLADPELMLKSIDSRSPPAPAGGSPLRWSPNVNRFRRRTWNEPERSRRVFRLVFANWLAYCDRPPGRRPPKVLKVPGMNLNPSVQGLLSDLYVVEADAPESLKALTPGQLASWFDSSIDATAVYPALNAVEKAIARERSLQGSLLVKLANELHKREHGKYPERAEELVGPYLKELPEGYATPK